MRQSAECGGNQDVRYQERSEMTLDYKKLFRWQETSSQGSFHVGMDRQPMRDFGAVVIDAPPGYRPVRYCCIYLPDYIKLCYNDSKGG